MNTIVIGLFDNKSRAQTVTKELAGAGFNAGHIHLASSGSAFKNAIAGANMAPDETNYYIGEIKRGAAAVAAESSPEQAKQAMQIMRSHKAKSAGMHTERELAFPVIEEELHIGKRLVEHGGVSIYSRITERPVEQKVQLREERINVKHRHVDRIASEQDMGMFREVRVDITQMFEEPVIAKEPHVVEEVIVSKEVVDHPKTIRETLRRADVEVKRLPEPKRNRATAKPVKKTAAARHGRR
ncbi:MAG: YsnF/AvaK domain-containing protein [Blastocatellia bacterium]